MKTKINPRLTKKLGRKRQKALQIEAFKRVARAVEPFDKKTQRRALHANLVLAAQ